METTKSRIRTILRYFLILLTCRGFGSIYVVALRTNKNSTITLASVHSLISGGAVSRWLFFASLVLNLALVGWYLARVTPLAAPQSILESTGATVSASRLDADEYSARLRKLNLSDEEIKRLLVAQLESRHVPPAPVATLDAYWSSSANNARVEYEQAIIDALDLVRSELIDFYGEDARHDPVFRRVFEPQFPKFTFLEPESQVALQRYQLSQSADQVNRATPTRVAQAPIGLPSPPDYGRILTELSRVLSEYEAFEYLYRYSPLADQLRSAGISFSEYEYRTELRSDLVYELN